MSDPQHSAEYRTLEAELAALHRNWQREQERYLVRGADGRLVEPAPRGIARDIFMMTGGVVGTALLSASPLPGWVAYIALAPFAIGTYRLMTASAKSEAYERAQTAYESQRARLLARMSAIARDENA